MLDYRQYCCIIGLLLVRETFRSDHNQMILQMLMQEVKTLNDSYEAEQIKGLKLVE